MSFDKLMRKKQRAIADRNKLQLAVACHNLGDWYQENQKYENALNCYRDEAAAYEELGKRIERARAHRMIGEMFMLLENFEKALEHELIYLKTAVDLKDKIEEQRAFATIGRVHLLKVQSNPGAQATEEMVKSVKNAEKAFLRSLLICKSLTDQSKKEVADMSARLYLNLGVTYECKEDYGEAIKYLEMAMSVCRHNDFWELLHQCYATTGLLYTNKMDDNTKALRFFSLAINTAERLSTNRTMRVCQTLLSKAEVQIKMADFQGAKQVLHRAYKMKTSDVSDRQSIEKTLKIVAAICYAENHVTRIESEDYARKKRLYETMGDGACRLKNFSAAIGYYGKMLEAAQQNDESGKQLIPIYVSLYQTYKDNKEYSSALDYMWREYELSKDEPSEAYSTLFGIAETYQLAGKDFWEIDGIFDRARQEAKKMKSKRKERQIMREQIELREKHELDTLAILMKEELKTLEENAPAAGLGHDDDDDNEEDAAIDSATSEEINTPDVGDEICLDDLTDSDSEQSEPKASTSAACNSTSTGRTRTLRKRNAIAIKRNEKGETQLHRACISGNATMVRRLIDQGHQINPRDNAGWLPLHEASNHGFTSIVEMLLDNGAWINDKGGTSCDGFTPLHDACGNGKLDTVELLLDRGANATLRNDLGSTPLQTLETWRKSVVLDAQVQSHYETIYARMKQILDKAGISLNDSPAKSKTRGKSVTPRKRILSSSSSDNENGERIETVNAILAEAFPASEPLENDSEELNSSPDYPPVSYREVMTDLRKGNFQNKVDSIRGSFNPVPKVTRRPGMLEENEVSTDEWLDDDIGPSRKKRRFIGGERAFSSDSNISNENRNSENQRQMSASLPLPYDANISSTNEQHIIEIDHNDSDEENSADAFNILMSASHSTASTSVRRRLRLSSGGGSSSSRQQQTSLIDNGFARYRLEAAESTSQQQSSVSSTVVSPHKNPNAMGAFAVKVKVEQNLLNVPVNGNQAHELTIEWLAEEAAKRYYNLKGVKPVLRLTTADGAIFENSDPLNLAFSETAPLASTVLDWIMPPLSQRYLEACATSKVVADQCIQSHLELVASTQSLTINDQIISSKLSRPLFKSLHFQTNLLTLDLSQCFLEDEGMKFLAQALPTISQLTKLILSGNLITVNGIKYLTSALEASVDAVLLPELATLNLSFNPLQNQSIPQLAKLCQHLPQLRSLSLSSVELADFQDVDLKFNALTEIDLSLNEFTSSGIANAIDRLNTCKLKQIDLSYCLAASARNSPNANELVDSLANVLNAGTCANLEEVHLSGCQLNDVDCWRIIQALSRSKQLLVVSLRDNPSLTKVTWKFLLENLCVRQLHLEGCSSLAADLTETDVMTLQAQSIEECSKNVTISMTAADGSNEPDASQIELLKRMWNVVSRDAGKMFKQNRNLLLTIEPELVANDDWTYLSV